MSKLFYKLAILELLPSIPFLRRIDELEPGYTWKKNKGPLLSASAASLKADGENSLKGLTRDWPAVEGREANLTPPQARSYRCGSPGVPRAYSLCPGERQATRERDTDSKDVHSYMVRLGHYGNVWGRPQGVKDTS